MTTNPDGDNDAPIDWRSEAARLAEALRLTQEYVGNFLLPPVEGWSWFDALKRYDSL